MLKLRTLFHDRYSIQSVLGAGGFGYVYKAHDASLNRIVALKVLNSSVLRDQESKQRFLREARIISLLKHKHITKLYHFDFFEDQPYFAMELAEGQPMSERIALSAVCVDDAIRWSIQAGEALMYAHKHGIIHRDIK